MRGKCRRGRVLAVHDERIAKNDRGGNCVPFTIRTRLLSSAAMVLCGLLVCCLSGCDSLRFVPLTCDEENRGRFVYSDGGLWINGVDLRTEDGKEVWAIASNESKKLSYFEVKIGEVPKGWRQLLPAPGIAPSLKAGAAYNIAVGDFAVMEDYGYYGGDQLRYVGGMVWWAVAGFIWSPPGDNSGAKK